MRLLDKRSIPCKHQRVRIGDVLRFKARRDEERKTTLDDLTATSEELGGYDALKVTVQSTLTIHRISVARPPTP